MDGDLIIKGIGEQREREAFYLNDVINKPRKRPVKRPVPNARSNISVSI